MKKYSLKKDDILSSQKRIKTVMDEGERFFQFPFRLIFQTNVLEKSNCQVLFSVPKRRFKLAVDRNLLRRRMKEAYRLNQYILKDYLEEKGKALSVVLIYSHSEKMAYADIEKKIILSLQQIKTSLQKQEASD